ncbi:MAG: DNA polymerase IV [Defluviitaleaceae bacterium]|nr:DNA polymerase IV [Defluviitaleaceae bacterium]
MASRIVLHVDNDNYFASVEEKFDPQLKKIPFAICGDPEMRHSVVMAKNTLAKKAGVITGISYRQAKQICPELGYVNADMEKYLEQTKLTREVFRKYSDDIIPYGLDEAWLSFDATSDSTSESTFYKEAVQIADLIRIEIKYSLGLSASVGVSDNYIFSKIGSDLKKPNSVTLITRENYKDLVWTLPASDLLFVGEKRKRLLLNAGIFTIGDIAEADPEFMEKLLGKVGHDLWRFANGDDRNFRPNSDRVGSIGNTITPPADLRSNDEVIATLYLLATTVCARLKKHGLKAGCISIGMRDNSFNKVIRQRSFKNTSSNVNFIFNQAYALFMRHYTWERPLRSIGIITSSLDSTEQLSLIPDECETDVDIDSRLKKLTARFGILKVENSAAIYSGIMQYGRFH